MRAAGISEFGGAVGWIDLPDPRPLADDEVLIEIRAAGVGNWEEFVRTGDWDVGRAPPMALGVEGAGTVTAIGDSVEDWEPDRKSTRLNSSHLGISYAVFCLKKKNT